jgi:hypothetical protein
LTRNFFFNRAHDIIDLKGSLTYQLAAAFLSNIMNDLARVVSSPQNKAIVTLYDIKNFRGSDSPYYFGGGAALYYVSHGASWKLSARGHLMSMLLCLAW